MKQYLDLLAHVINCGVDKPDRTGTGTRNVFGYQMRFNLDDGFPLLTTKKMFIQGIIDELLWFISGSTNCNDLPERSQHWWKPWADADGNVGSIYGEQYRRSKWYEVSNRDLPEIKETDAVTCININYDHCNIQFVEVDQLLNLINGIKNDPHSRRHMINLWHTPAMLATNLPCCHGSIIQCDVTGGTLSMQVYQRSADVFIGLPVNIASYSLLLMMIAQVCNLEVGELVFTIGQTHIYHNHFDQVKEQLSRDPLPLPNVILNKNIDNIFDFTYSDFELVGYWHKPAIKAPVAI